MAEDEQNFLAKYLSQITRMPMAFFYEIAAFLVGGLKADREQARQNFKDELRETLHYYHHTMIRDTTNKENSFGRLSVTVISLAANDSVNSVDIAACSFLVNATNELLISAGEVGLPTAMVYKRDIDLGQQLEVIKRLRAKGFVGLKCGSKAEKISVLAVACSRLQNNPNVKGRHFWLLNEMIKDIA
uniref:Uncharacterized protein n=1 Tax=Ditylenchus dipsaci TaxID=166011 RepID=A0A915D9Y9_9BILA